MTPEDGGERRRPASITLYFDDVPRSIPIEEASPLSDWLYKTRVLAAQRLGKRLEEEITINAEDRAGVELDSGARSALRNLLTDVDLHEYTGLKKLAEALQGEIWSEPLEGEGPFGDRADGPGR